MTKLTTWATLHKRAHKLEEQNAEMNTNSLSKDRFCEDLIVGTRYVLPGEKLAITQRWQEMGCYYLTLRTKREDSAPEFDVAINSLQKTGQDSYLVLQHTPNDVIDFAEPPLYLVKVVSQDELLAVTATNVATVLNTSLCRLPANQSEDLLGSFPDWDSIKKRYRI